MFVSVFFLLNWHEIRTLFVGLVLFSVVMELIALAQYHVFSLLLYFFPCVILGISSLILILMAFNFFSMVLDANAKKANKASSISDCQAPNLCSICMCTCLSCIHMHEEASNAWQQVPGSPSNNEGIIFLEHPSTLI